DKIVSGRALDGLGDYLAAEVEKARGFSIVPRGEIRERLTSAKAESYRACYDDACQIELGKALAASKVVATRGRRVAAQRVLAGYLFDWAREATDATATARCECSEDGVLAGIEEAVKQLKPALTAEATPRVPDTFRGMTVRATTRKDRQSA